MNIAANGNRAAHRLHIAFSGEDFSCLHDAKIFVEKKLCMCTYLIAEILDFVLWNRLIVKELFYLPIELRNIVHG